MTKTVMPLSGRGAAIDYRLEGNRINVEWGSQRFALTADDINMIMRGFFGETGEWRQLGASMTDPPSEGLGNFILTRFRGLSPRHASAIAAIMVNEGYLQSRGARPIELKRV